MKKLTIETNYNIEDVVFLITDTEQLLRIVTAIQISKNGILYRLACGTSESWHYDYELAKDKNYAI